MSASPTLGTREDPVISASGTLGTRDEAVILAFGTLEAREDPVASAGCATCSVDGPFALEKVFAPVSS